MIADLLRRFLDRLRAPAPAAPLAPVIRTGRVLSQGCGR